MLVDTSVLVRTLQPHHSLYTVGEGAIRVLPAQGRELHIAPQNLVELWVVATRPFGENGLGMSATHAATELERIKRMFAFLPETRCIPGVGSPGPAISGDGQTGRMTPDLWLRCGSTGSTKFSPLTGRASRAMPASRSSIPPTLSPLRTDVGVNFKDRHYDQCGTKRKQRLASKASFSPTAHYSGNPSHARTQGRRAITNSGDGRYRLACSERLFWAMMTMLLKRRGLTAAAFGLSSISARSALIGSLTEIGSRSSAAVNLARATAPILPPI